MRRGHTGIWRRRSDIRRYLRQSLADRWASSVSPAGRDEVDGAVTDFHLHTNGSMSKVTRVMVRRPDLRAYEAIQRHGGQSAVSFVLSALHLGPRPTHWEREIEHIPPWTGNME